MRSTLGLIIANEKSMFVKGIITTHTFTLTTFFYNSRLRKDMNVLPKLSLFLKRTQIMYIQYIPLP